MARFRNVRTGVVVTVGEVRAEAMGPEFERVEAGAGFEPAPKKLTAAQKKAAAEAAEAAEADKTE